MDSQAIFDGCVEYLHEQTTKRIMRKDELPVARMDVVQIFDEVRTEIMSRFRDILRLAYTKEERASIVLKMEQLE